MKFNVWQTEQKVNVWIVSEEIKKERRQKQHRILSIENVLMTYERNKPNWKNIEFEQLTRVMKWEKQ